MSFLRLTGSLISAMGITLICCFMAPLMSQESDLRLPAPLDSIQIFALPSPMKKPAKIKIIPKKIFQASHPRRKKKLKREPIRPQEIRLNQLKMETVPLMAANLPAPLPVVVKPRMVDALKTGPVAGGIYQSGAVDVQPRLKRYRPPLYPPRAKGQRIEGKVVVRCVVSAGGKVNEAKIIKAKPAGYFERAALKAVKNWTFVPAILNGKKVSVYVDIPLSFTLD